MANWDKGFYAPVTGVWHDVVSASVDTKLSFFSISNISRYEVARTVVAIGASDDEPILAPTGLSLTEAGGIGTTQYEYLVTAVKPDGRETDPSAIISVTTAPATLNTTDYHTLSWNAVSGASKYRLFCRKGGPTSLVIFVVELTALTYMNKGEMVSAEAWPWINLTGVTALLAWSDLAPGTGLEPISRPMPLAVGSRVMIFTTGPISAFASGEV